MPRLFPFFFFLLPLFLQAQYQPSNQAKYLKYRERFLNHFISVGEGKGRSLPFAHVIYKNDGKKGAHILQGGEQTHLLGTYIGFLGTEYLLYKKSGLDTSQSLLELYYALRALNRLDYYAETYNGYGQEPSLDGFFVREDVGEEFTRNNIKGFQASRANNRRGYERGMGIIGAVDSVENMEQIGCYEHTPMSQDHTIRILWGLNLLHHCLDDSISYRNLPFLDGEIYLKQEALNIFNRIIEKCKRDGWILREPDGKEVKNCFSRTGGIFTFRNNLLNAHHRLNQIDKVNLHLPVLARAVAGLTKVNGWLNTRLWLESKNLSGEASETWHYSYKYGYETYFINYGILLYGWEFDAEKRKELRENSEFYLNVAPCEGPFYHTAADFSELGWATPDRTERSLEYQYMGIGHVRGNYSGLDYLLLHNLYYLVNFDSLPAFEPYAQELTCPTPLSAQDLLIGEKEMERMWEQLSGGQKKDATLLKKWGKHDLKLRYK
jgi:hypothetical protein